MLPSRRRTLARMLALTGPVLLGGCVIADGGGGGGGGLGDFGGLFGGSRTVEYRCDNDRRFTAAFNEDRDRVTVEAGDRTYRLRLEDRDGSRRRYGEDDVQLTVDGDEARLRIKDERDYSGCEAR